MDTDPKRQSRQPARRLAEAVAALLAVAGLLAFVLAPLFSGPRPWPGGKATDPAVAAKATEPPAPRADAR